MNDMTDLLVLAEAQIAEKQVKEIEAIKQRLDADKEVLKEAIALVNSHTLYKREGDSRGRYKYVLATEEMLKADYLGEPERYAHKGISFHYDEWKANYNKGIMEVNGHTYYDIRYALNNYEKLIKDKESQVSYLNTKISELKEDLARLHESYPTLKQAVMDWMAYQEADKESEE
jgi:hypothetical protein